MTIGPAAFLAQCPCSGGGSGSDSSGIAAWLLLTIGFSVLLLARSIWNKKGASFMGKAGKLAVVIVLAVVVVGVLVMKKGGSSAMSAPPATQPVAGLPRLVDLGSTSCMPCKMMAPILEELKKQYAGRLQVEVIDVGKDPDAAKKYDISVIPVQVFYDATGKERFRHDGFFAKEDILAKWKELGVDLSATATAPTSAPVPAVKTGST